MRCLYVLCCILFCAATSFTSPAKNNVTIQLESYVGNDTLQLDDKTYKNSLGQQYTITKFKYYIGNIHLQKKNGADYFLPEYFLVNEDEPGSKKLILKDVPEGEYTSIRFTIGVDSLHNCSGAQSGALDPINAMFWTWNTGYIFLKLEGKAPVSTSPGHIFEFHIGGYKQPANCIRNVSLPFNKALFVSPGGHSVIKMKVDASEILKDPTTIDLSKLSSVTDLHNATTIADNYADMFSILNIE